MSKLFKRTKILATIGPAVFTEEKITDLIMAGVNGCRLNFSHGNYMERDQQIAWIRAAAAKKGRSVAILQDLQGPKIRLGEIKDNHMDVKAGDELILDSAITEHDGSNILPVQYNLAEKALVDEPIYIFDGTAPELKSETQAKRREIREESEKIYKEALAEGDTEKARKYAMRSSKLSSEIIESSKKLLTLMGIPYVEAKGEGEAQAAYLVSKGDAYAVASQDYDCLLFGAKRVVRNLAVSSNLGNLEFYELDKVLRELDITRE